MKDLTKEIKKAMIDTGLSAQDLADRLGVPVRTMYRWIKHPERMMVSNYLNLNELLGGKLL